MGENVIPWAPAWDGKFFMNIEHYSVYFFKDSFFWNNMVKGKSLPSLPETSRL